MISGLHHFDSWLSRSTWYTLHPDEEKLFYLALKKIIAENPGVLIHEQYVRDYILNKKSQHWLMIPSSKLPKNMGS